jgi:hypothetical protein
MEIITLAKCHDQELQGFTMEGKNLLEFRNNIHNFRNSIKFSMNFYRFKLALARLKLIDILDTKYIYLIFLKPRAD